MGGLSLPHLIVLALVVLVLFGRGRISEMMGDFGKGIKSFKQGMNDEDNKPVTPPPAQIQQTPPPAAPTATPAPTSTDHAN
ncbi:MAG: twin-arginine translocase TatA/TatE family subunit [Novosphingobium sp.]|jgi:sec-independent protein translocase protein TatA